jgi:lipoprotein-anchoring transpeptidase ErfK/SrfK
VRATLVVTSLAALVAGILAASSHADTTPPPATTTTATTPVVTTPVVTTTNAPAPKPKLVTKTVRSGAAATHTWHAQTVFPAAGELNVNAVTVRRSPDPKAPVVRVMHQFREDYRIQEILALAMRVGKDHKPWYRINLPMRPNGTYGWIPARAAAVKPTVSQIFVHRSSRTIEIFWHGKLALRAPVAIGAPGMETPVGHFYVAARFVPYQDPFLGVFAVETSAYSKLTEWPGGGVVGIHGTSAPQLLGQAVSHGCVRVSNQTAEAMKKLAPLGTPITVTA